MVVKDAMWNKIKEAYMLVSKGLIGRADIDSRVKIYRVQNAIRIDIKDMEVQK